MQRKANPKSTTNNNSDNSIFNLLCSKTYDLNLAIQQRKDRPNTHTVKVGIGEGFRQDLAGLTPVLRSIL